MNTENEERATITLPFNYKAIFLFVLIASGFGAGTGIAQLRQQPSKQQTVVIDSESAAAIATVMAASMKESMSGIERQLSAMRQQSDNNDAWCRGMTEKLSSALHSLNNNLSYMNDRLDKIERRVGNGQ